PVNQIGQFLYPCSAGTSFDKRKPMRNSIYRTRLGHSEEFPYSSDFPMKANKTRIVARCYALLHGDHSSQFPHSMISREEVRIPPIYDGLSLDRLKSTRAECKISYLRKKAGSLALGHASACPVIARCRPQNDAIRER